jgi:hypothetical protein
MPGIEDLSLPGAGDLFNGLVREILSMSGSYLKPLATILIASAASALLAACHGNAGNGSSLTPTLAPTVMRSHQGFPPVCTVPKVKSGANATSVAAFGTIKKRVFMLAQPSSWFEVQWLKVLPPDPKTQEAWSAMLPPHAVGNNYTYYGTYTVSDGTTGCLYIVTSINGGPINSARKAALTAQPRIPPTGATLPVDSGVVGSITLTVNANGTGKGSMQLVHSNGSKALSGTLRIVGRIGKPATTSR